MKLLFICFAAVAASGCVTAPSVVVDTKTVEVPVAVRCRVEFPKKPTPYLSEARRHQSLLEKGNAALAELKERQGYELQLEAALTKCADPL